jgi:uncharacterized protein YbjT (DUF2867 family)
MEGEANEPKAKRITILGGTGHVGVAYVEEFLSAGLSTRILAREPEKVVPRYRRAEVVRGSMLDAGDVTRAMDGADVGFLITPIGGNNDPRPELDAARSAITAARVSGLPHLIYASQVLPDRPTGVAILDAKVRIEEMLASSGVAWSSLCVGCYMDEWLGMAPRLLRLGLLLNPLSACRPFSFTCKQDVARVAVDLARKGRTLNGSLDVVEPTPHTLADAAALIGEVLGRKVVASGSWPLLPLMRAARVPLGRVKPIAVSKIMLGTYFDEHGYVGNPAQMAALMPGFEVTTLEVYLRRALAREPRGSTPARAA